MQTEQLVDARSFHKTPFGQIINGDSLNVLASYANESVDLIMTSPPFGLVRQKDYGNVSAGEYVEWFKPFAEQFKRVLKDSGSLVIDIGGSWNKGNPTRSLYHFKLLILLCDEFGFHLAQEFYWWNPSKLPTPAEWVTVRRVRVKDAINTVWWLSKTPWPKASNRRVLQPYSLSMMELLEKGYKAKKRPSGHDISRKFSTDNGAAIPPNLIAIPNTESNSFYLRYCKKHGFKPHPARYPADLPEYFIRMLTDAGDFVVDPFAGSCVTGEVCERLHRSWSCIELLEEYCLAAMGRFVPGERQENIANNPAGDSNYYRIPRPGILWNGYVGAALPKDGGKERRIQMKIENPEISPQARPTCPQNDAARNQLLLLEPQGLYIVQKTPLTLLGTYRKDCREWILKNLLYNYPVTEEEIDSVPELSLVKRLVLRRKSDPPLCFSVNGYSIVGKKYLLSLGYKPGGRHPVSQKYILYKLTPLVFFPSYDEKHATLVAGSFPIEC
jgi:site-specific DNA-methyltransferase (cytosine-N4-specific)